MSKNITLILITIALTSIASYYISKTYFAKKVTGMKTQFESCMDKCEEQPYSDYDKKLKIFTRCKSTNDSLNALIKDCSHIVDLEARERCEEKNNKFYEQLKPCIIPIYQDYIDCLASNVILRGKMRECLPYKPNYEKCMEDNAILEAQLVNCDSLLMADEMEYRKCKGVCQDLITLYR